MTQVAEAIKSITLQREHNLRQMDIVRMKQQEARTHHCFSNTSANCSTNYLDSSQSTLQHDDYDGVYRTMHECDSLLQFLTERHSIDPAVTAASENAHRSPKDDSTIIEELRLHNSALRQHIVDLLRDIETQGSDLEHYKMENARLHARVHDVERRAKMSDSADSEFEYSLPQAVRMKLADFSSLELPPLEMPKFDLAILKTNNSESSE